MKSWIAFWSILMKDMRTYYFKPPNISWGIIFPLAWTLMLFLRSGTAVDVRSLLPGGMSIAVLFGTTSMLAVTITFERRGRSFERLLLAPINLNLLLLAKTSGAILFGMFNGFVPVLLALFLADVSRIDWFSALGAVFLMAVTSTFLGLLIAVSVREVFEAQTLSNFFRFPMVFLCGLFIPVEILPVFLKPLSYVAPLTYGVDILRTAVIGAGQIKPLLSFLVLIASSLALFALSTRIVKRRWIY
jgi:ABC-2 type transport system permease protein